MMQKQFITPKRFWYVGVIALTVLLTGSSCPRDIALVENDTVGLEKVDDIIITKEWKNKKTGKNICVKKSKKTQCNEPVECGGDNSPITGTPLAKFLQLDPERFDPVKTQILTPADACGIIVIDDGKDNSFSACFPPPVGCITFG